MPGLLLGGLVVATPRMTPECGDVRPVAMETRQGTFDGAASVELMLACGDLSVTTAPGSDWQLEAGNARSAGAAVEASADRLSITSADREHMFDFIRGADVWRLSLPDGEHAGPGRGGERRAWSVRPGRCAPGEPAADGERRRGPGRPGRRHGRPPVDERERGEGLAGACRRPATSAPTSPSTPAPSRSARRTSSACGSTTRSCSASTTYAGLVRVGDTWESPGLLDGKPPRGRDHLGQRW